jgi:hypothetical protein
VLREIFRHNRDEITGEWRRLHYEELYEMFGIAARYGLDGPGIEYRWGRDFPHPARRSVAHPASYTKSTGSSPGVSGLGVALTTHLI